MIEYGVIGIRFLTAATVSICLRRAFQQGECHGTRIFELPIQEQWEKASTKEVLCREKILPEIVQPNRLLMFEQAAHIYPRFCSAKSLPVFIHCQLHSEIDSRSHFVYLSPR
jgi:hypothetical protein